MRVSVILLAGGTGTRMGTKIPKQFLPLNDKIVARHSYDLFASMPEVAEIIVVCHPEYQHLFNAKCVLPGQRRQDSVYNGFQAITSKVDLVCIHDSARPLVSEPLVRRVCDAGLKHGAATVGVPVKFTIKENDGRDFVRSTPDRSTLWEIQTPQAIKPELLQKGFDYVQQNGLTITDDVSLVELLNIPVKLVEGDDDNLKITTQQDFLLAAQLIKR